MARTENPESTQDPLAQKKPPYVPSNFDADVVLRGVSEEEDKILPVFFRAGPTSYAFDPDGKRIKGRGNNQPCLFSKRRLADPSKPFRLDEPE